MDSTVFYIQFAFSVVVCGLLAKWFLSPWLEKQQKMFAILVLLIPHAFRHFGLFAISQATYAPELPMEWARSTAYIDLGTQITALLTMLLIRRGSGLAKVTAWVANLLGLTAFAVSTWLTSSLNVPIHFLYASWFLPTFFLPMLVWSHYYQIRLLLKKD